MVSSMQCFPAELDALELVHCATSATSGIWNALLIISHTPQKGLNENGKEEKKN